MDIKLLKHQYAQAKKRAEECASMAREELYKSGARAFELQAEYYKGMADALELVVNITEEGGVC